MRGKAASTCCGTPATMRAAPQELRGSKLVRDNVMHTLLGVQFERIVRVSCGAMTTPAQLWTLATE